MSNAFFNSIKYAAATATLDFAGETLLVALLNAGYTFDPTASDANPMLGFKLTGCTPQSLATKAVDASAVCTADSTVFTGVDAGQTCQGVLIYQDQGGGVLKPFCWFDTGAGLPITTSGADITINWANTPINGEVFHVDG